MALEVLKDKMTVASARREMRSRGIDCLDGPLTRLFKRWHILPGVVLGDQLKSWDVLKTVKFLDEHLTRHDPILDLGAYASELLPALRRCQYRELTGVDLNPHLCAMPHGDSIDYTVGDIYDTGFPDASYAAITAISVIEHGFDAERLLMEVSRLLKPGGYFIASVDYWPEKIYTDGIEAFGMEWMIFSRDDLISFFDRAGRYGLEACGRADYQAGEPTANWFGRSYTFAWMALRKTGTRP